MKGPKRLGPFRQEYERNKKKVLLSQDTCGICGKPFDKSLPGTHPMGPTIDHINPIVRGGHPADINNLQLAQRSCNRQKSDSLQAGELDDQYTNRNLPWLKNWREYQPKSK